MPPHSAGIVPVRFVRNVRVWLRERLVCALARASFAFVVRAVRVAGFGHPPSAVELPSVLARALLHDSLAP
jgi:hypothetical protein